MMATKSASFSFFFSGTHDPFPIKVTDSLRVLSQFFASILLPSEEELFIFFFIEVRQKVFPFHFPLWGSPVFFFSYFMKLDLSFPFPQAFFSTLHFFFWTFLSNRTKVTYQHSVLRSFRFPSHWVLPPLSAEIHWG